MAFSAKLVKGQGLVLESTKTELMVFVRALRLGREVLDNFGQLPKVKAAFEDGVTGLEAIVNMLGGEPEEESSDTAAEAGPEELAAETETAGSETTEVDETETEEAPFDAPEDSIEGEIDTRDHNGTDPAESELEELDDTGAEGLDEYDDAPDGEELVDDGEEELVEDEPTPAPTPPKAAAKPAAKPAAAAPAKAQAAAPAKAPAAKPAAAPAKPAAAATPASTAPKAMTLEEKRAALKAGKK